jgi:molybdenum cofactor guanylyltransferase
MLLNRTDIAGFVLAGGRSSRMGLDKALLGPPGNTLLDRAASAVRDAAGCVTIIGDPARYAHLGFAVVPDVRAGFGPLGGIVTGLSITEKTWNLFVACDMPGADRAFLEWLLAEADRTCPPPDCVVPVGASGPEPLCAVYHVRALAAMQHALDRNILKMRTVVGSLQAKLMAVPDHDRFRNINTPEDWAAHV